jgi:TolB-like protein/Flp pilus assembly protein TadD
MRDASPLAGDAVLSPVKTNGNDSSASIPADLVRKECEKVLTGTLFSRSQRMRAFLSYIVEKSLSGEPADLKEYRLAIEVFERRSTFDPASDPIVRVEAGRLRARLKEYYRKEGRRDDIRIECGKGGYQATFLRYEVPIEKGVARTKRSTTTRKRATVAVLPFIDLSHARDQEYFCDGIAEELIALLGQVAEIRVVSRTSSFAFKGKSLDIREIGKRLNADAIIEGSVRKDGDRLRISAQLTMVADGLELWSETHERTSADLFLIQDEISRSIIDNLKRKMLGYKAEPLIERYTADPDAYRLYLHGRHYWSKRTEESLKTGIRYFEQAIARDANYAAAYAGIADSYAILGNRAVLAPAAAMPQAKNAALKAISLNSGLGEAHASFALVRSLFDWEWADAEKEFLAAIDLNPAYATARQWYAFNCLVPTGRLDEAVHQLQQTLDLDPVSRIVNSVLGQLYAMQGKPEEAVVQLNKTLELDENFYLTHWYLGLAYCNLGRFSDALNSLKRANKQAGVNPSILGAIGMTHARNKNQAEAFRILEELRGLSTRRYVCAGSMAQILAALEDDAGALEYLQQAYRDRSASLVHLLVNPAYQRLHRHREFTKLARNVGLVNPIVRK